MEQWRKIVARSPRSYCFYCKNLASGKVIYHRPNKLMDPASVIKLPILLALLNKVQRGELSLKQRIKLEQRHIGRNGSGILQVFDFEAPFLLHNLATLMITDSDNVAANVIIELIGKSSINEYVRYLGCENTKLAADKLDFPDDYASTDQQIGVTTATDTASMVEQLTTGNLLSQELTNFAMRVMKATVHDSFCRRLPFRQLKAWGNKTGSMYFEHDPVMVYNDCGYIIDKRDTTYIFAMFASGLSDIDFAFTDDSKVKNEFADVAQSIFTELRR